MAKCKGYKFAVQWIAENDDPSVMDLDTIQDNIDVVLIADLFGVAVAKVAIDILKSRKNSERINDALNN